MAFASRGDVMATVEGLVRRVCENLNFPRSSGWTPNQADEGEDQHDPRWQHQYLHFGKLTYEQAMQRYGSDKPDRRIATRIHQVESWIPKELKSMLTRIENPIIEMLCFRAYTEDTATVSKFVTDFLDAPSASDFINNPDGAPGVTVFDSRKPVSGLAAFGFEAASKVEELFKPADGDVILLQARPNKPFSGGSTMLGRLRKDISQAAFARGLGKHPTSNEFSWITYFPLFSPVETPATSSYSTAPRL